MLNKIVYFTIIINIAKYRQYNFYLHSLKVIIDDMYLLYIVIILLSFGDHLCLDLLCYY